MKSKTDFFLLAFEDTGSGRNMEVYYNSLKNSTSIRPIMAYTKRESFNKSPVWIKNKVLYDIPGVDHDISDCKYASCKKPAKDHRTYEDWFDDCKTYIGLLKSFGSNRRIWLLDAIKPEIEKYLDGNIVQVFHGELFNIGISYYDHVSSFEKYNLILTQGKRTADFIDKFIPKKFTKGKVKTMGRLLDEELTKEKFNKDEILKEYRLNPGNKTIIFAPSWESRSYWPAKSRITAKNELASLCDFCEKNKFNLIIRPHIILVKHFNVEAYYEVLDKKYKNVYFDNTAEYANYNPNKSLSAADIMITDLSSIAVDFLSLKKPVIFKYPPKEILEQYVTPPTFAEVASVSYVSMTLDELKNMLLSQLKRKSTKLLHKSIINEHIKVSQKDSPAKIFRHEIEGLIKEDKNSGIKIIKNVFIKVLGRILIDSYQKKYYLSLKLEPS